MRLHVLWVGEDRLGRGAPRLVGVLEEGGRAVEVELAGAFSWVVGRGRTCVGRIVEGAHAPCPTRQAVSVHGQCAACSGLEDPACIFEPRCEGDPGRCACVRTFRDVGHAVYVALFGTLPKVGMTQAWRLEARAREQGADAYFAVAAADPATGGPLDRGMARRLERQVHALYRIPEHRSHREVLPQLARPVPWEQVESRAEALRLRLAERFPVEEGLHRVLHPLPQPLPSPPHRVRPEGRHVGQWMGIKGNNLVYAEAPRPGRLRVGGPPPHAALKRSDLAGRTVDVQAEAEAPGQPPHLARELGHPT